MTDEDAYKIIDSIAFPGTKTGALMYELVRRTSPATPAPEAAPSPAKTRGEVVAEDASDLDGDRPRIVYERHSDGSVEVGQLIHRNEISLKHIREHVAKLIIAELEAAANIAERYRDFTYGDGAKSASHCIAAAIRAYAAGKDE